MFPNDAIEQPIRLVVWPRPDSRHAVAGLRGPGLAVLLRPVSATPADRGGRGAVGNPLGSPSGQGSGMKDHLKSWPVTYAFVGLALALGTIVQVIYA